MIGIGADRFTEDELRAAMWSHGMNDNALALKIEIARAQATAYVWGRQDAGEGTHDTGYSLDFGQHYATVTREFYGGKTFSMGNIEREFERWRATHEA